MYFNNNDIFNAELNDVLTGCVAKGSDYIYAYRNAAGKLAFQWADSLGVIEVRARDTADKRDYVIYHYVDRIDKDSEPIIKIQVWDEENVTYFIQEGSKGIRLDENEEIKVLTVPVEEALRDMGTGLYDNGIMMAAAGFFMRYAEKRKDLRQSSTLTR